MNADAPPCIQYGLMAAAELGCTRLTLAATAECLRGVDMAQLLRVMRMMIMMMLIMMMMMMRIIIDDDNDDQIEFLNELMSHPTIDGGHCSEPYLPTEPAELLQSGDYATEVDVLIGEGEGRDGAAFVLILVLCSAP